MVARCKSDYADSRRPGERHAAEKPRAASQESSAHLRSRIPRVVRKYPRRLESRRGSLDVLLRLSDLEPALPSHRTAKRLRPRFSPQFLPALAPWPRFGRGTRPHAWTGFRRVL